MWVMTFVLEMGLLCRRVFTALLSRNKSIELPPRVVAVGLLENIKKRKQEKIKNQKGIIRNSSSSPVSQRCRLMHRQIQVAEKNTGPSGRSTVRVFPNIIARVGIGGRPSSGKLTGDCGPMYGVMKWI